MKSVALGEVADIERKGVDPSALPPNTMYLGLEHIERGGRIIGHDTVAGAELASTKFRFSTEHVLFGKLRPNLGKVSRPDFEGVCSTDILPIRPGKELDRDYLAHYLAQPSMVDFAASRTSGANLPRLSPSVLAKFPIPLPPLAEQRRIAAILDQADSLRARRRQVLARLDVLTKSIFNEMFGAPLTNPKGLPRATIGSVAAVVTGNSPSPADDSNFGDSIEWIKSGNLGEDVASTADEWLSETGRAKARVAPSGSILVTCIAGSPTSIGKASLVDRDVAFNQQINAILPSDKIDTAFLFGQLKTAPKLVRAKSTGGMKGIVNKSAFQSIEILLPRIDLQRGFAERIASLASLQSIARSSLTAEDGLFASLQSRAFRGEL